MQVGRRTQATRSPWRAHALARLAARLATPSFAVPAAFFAARFATLLTMLFAAQFPKMWGTTSKRYAHCGHRHHVDEKEYAGMTVTQHPTLAARDAHSARGGWISERAAALVTYHEKFGQVARTIVCPEMFEAA